MAGYQEDEGTKKNVPFEHKQHAISRSTDMNTVQSTGQFFFENSRCEM